MTVLFSEDAVAPFFQSRPTITVEQANAFHAAAYMIEVHGVGALPFCAVFFGAGTAMGLFTFEAYCAKARRGDVSNEFGLVNFSDITALQRASLAFVGWMYETIFREYQPHDPLHWGQIMIACMRRARCADVLMHAYDQTQLVGQINDQLRQAKILVAH